MKEYRSAQAEVLNAHGMSIPKDFFSFSSPGCLFSDRAVAHEKTINSNKVKVYTEYTLAANTEQLFFVFTLEKVDGRWIIMRIRDYSGKTGKESSILW